MGDVAAADQALADAKLLWSGKPSVAWYHYAALSAALLGDVDRAQQLLQEGLLQHQRAAALHNNLAALLERRGAYDEALREAERGLATDPAMAQLHKNVGDLYYRGKHYDDALTAFERAVKADVNLGDDVYVKLGNIRMQRKERDEAAKCWQRALELDPNNATARMNLAKVKTTR
jgi:Tfp pilus assembly protein PilF